MAGAGRGDRGIERAAARARRRPGQASSRALRYFLDTCKQAGPRCACGETDNPHLPLGSARLLTTIEGAGHAQATIDSPCADRAIERHLIAGELPDRGAACADPADPWAE